LTAAAGSRVRRITVQVQVGSDKLAASDDPIFLGLRGAHGREFRLHPTRGKPWRKGSEMTWVLAGANDPETNVAMPELNDPARPAIESDAVASAYLRKGLDPIPNVRGHGEMDDRIQIERIEVTLHTQAGAEVRFGRDGEFWLGLVCGLCMELAPLDGGA
jgi:hypothetical protein